MTAPRLLEAQTRHRDFLWKLCFRLTGCAADADELVQETFVRVLARPPADLEAPLEPYLTRVATNLSLDVLRRRKASGGGPWLPSAVETGEEAAVPSGGERYELLESASFAFLLALEALTPVQRAVLVLREVFELEAVEVAPVLGLSPGNVRVVHHRARTAMAGYDAARVRPTREAQAATRAALEALMTCVLAGDVEGAQRLLAPSVRAESDGGGQYHAAGKPVVGAERVVAFLARLAELRGPPLAWRVAGINGLPALLLTHEVRHPGEAPHTVMAVTLEPGGAIASVLTQLADRKLAGLRFA